MAATTIFTFQPTTDHAPVNIRTTLIDGEPWFVAKDVCLALGYPITPGISNANSRYACLWNRIDARNEKSLRWLDWTGFRLIDALPEFGRERRLFFTFARLSHV